MSKIELDYTRMEKFQKLSIDLATVAEQFRHGDILLREVNSILQETKDLIDAESETSFTKQDFDDMLSMRNTVLTPIFQNASFAVEFAYYTEPVIEEPIVEQPVVDPSIGESVTDPSTGTDI